MADVVIQQKERAWIAGDHASAPAVAEARWFVLWTRSHCEQLVHDQLAPKGFHPFLPTIEVWSRRAHLRHRIRVPMFPGYLFLHDALDRRGDAEVRKARGLVGILGDGWDRRANVPPHEVEAIRQVVNGRVAARPHPYLKKGQRVRITRGPMADVEGILLRVKENKGFLVLSVDLLQRSVAVEVDCTLAVPVQADCILPDFHSTIADATAIGKDVLVSSLDTGTSRNEQGAAKLTARPSRFLILDRRLAERRREQVRVPVASRHQRGAS